MSRRSRLPPREERFPVFGGIQLIQQILSALLTIKQALCQTLGYKNESKTALVLTELTALQMQKGFKYHFVSVQQTFVECLLSIDSMLKFIFNSKVFLSPLFFFIFKIDSYH